MADVTAYCLPSMSPGRADVGAVGVRVDVLAPLGVIVRDTTTGALMPSNGRNVAVAVVVCAEVLMMNGSRTRRRSGVMLGSDTVVAPA
jgi:hypothetical protein